MDLISLVLSILSNNKAINHRPQIIKDLENIKF